MKVIDKIEIDGVTYDIGGGSGSTNAKFIGKYYSNDEGMQESNFEDVPLEENKMYLMLYSYDGGTSRSFIFCTKPDDFGEYYLPVGIYARFVPNTLYIGIDQYTVSTYDDYVEVYELPITFSSEGGSNTSNSTTSREVLYLNSEKQDIDLPTWKYLYEHTQEIALNFGKYDNSYLIIDLHYILNIYNILNNHNNEESGLTSIYLNLPKAINTKYIFYSTNTIYSRGITIQTRGLITYNSSSFENYNGYINGISMYMDYENYLNVENGDVDFGGNSIFIVESDEIGNIYVDILLNNFEM